MRPQRTGGKSVVPILSVLTLWLVIGFWSSELQPAPPSQRELASYADGLSRTVHGRITRIRELPPRAQAGDSDADTSEWEEDTSAPVLSFDLTVDAIEYLTPDLSQMVPATGGVRITLSGDAPALRCGDTVEAPLRLRTPERYRDPGAWQYADYLAVQGIGAHATLQASHLILTTAPSGDVNLRCRLYAAQTWAANRLLAFTASRPNRLLPHLVRLTPEDAGMLNAMLFGDRDRLHHTLRLGFERTGSFHLFVVSGMHVALLAAALFWLTRRLRIPAVPATLITIAATALYALLTGFGAPVQRALLMSSIFLIARLLQRDANVLNSLGAAILGVLVLSPSSLYESSFQMTFLVILAIAGIAIPLGEWSFLPYARAARYLDDLWRDSAMHPRLAQFRILLRIYGEHLEPLLSPIIGGRRALHLPATFIRWLLWALELLLISVVAELVMLLPMALYFHRATLFALPANAFSIPLVAVLAPLALVTFLLSLVSPWLAAIPAAATALLLHAITGIISRISQTHLADWRIPGPSLFIAAIAVLAWITCCWLVRRSRRHALIAALSLPLIAALILWPEQSIRTAETLELTAIDVGQGDSLLLVSPEGRTMLIDAGGPVGRTGSISASSAASSFDIGEDVVSPYLWSRRIRRLDIVALTHAHSDHMGGMPAILRNFRPRELWVGIDPGSPAYAALLNEAADLHILVRHLHAGDATDIDELHITTLSPSSSYENHGPPANNDSLVLRVDYGLASALLEGDAEAPSERAMLAANSIRPVTLLKVGHHGSRTSTTPEFFAAAAPRAAVISVGRDNTFGHPRAEVIARIAAAHTLLYRTDWFGLSQFLLTKDGNIQESETGGRAP